MPKYRIRFDTLYLSNCITKNSCVGKLAIIDLDTIFTLVERDWHVCWHKYEINYLNSDWFIFLVFLVVSIVHLFNFQSHAHHRYLINSLRNRHSYLHFKNPSETILFFYPLQDHYDFNTNWEKIIGSFIYCFSCFLYH